jgi:hypothetical protein
VAEAGGEIVGHYAATPIRFKLRDRAAIVPHGSDAMTRSDFRRRGILTSLGRRANEVWDRAGSPFQIGFPLAEWGSVREDLGWKAAVRLVWMKHWIRPVAYLARRLGWTGRPSGSRADLLTSVAFHRKKTAPAGGRDPRLIRVEPVSRADDSFDRLWERISPAYAALAVRDRSWVQWRLFDVPGAEHRVFLAADGDGPRGYIALRTARRAGIVRAAVVDCLFAPADHEAAGVLLDRAVGHAAALGAHNLAALSEPGSPLYRHYRRAGFRGGRLGYDFSIIPYASCDPQAWADGWFVTGAEGDVV